MCLVQSSPPVPTWYDNRLSPSIWFTTSSSTNESYFREGEGITLVPWYAKRVGIENKVEMVRYGYDACLLTTA